MLWYVTDIQLRFYGHAFLSCQLSSFFVIVFKSLRLLLLVIPRTGTVRSSVNAHRSTARHTVHLVFHIRLFITVLQVNTGNNTSDWTFESELPSALLPLPDLAVLRSRVTRISTLFHRSLQTDVIMMMMMTQTLFLWFEVAYPKSVQSDDICVTLTGFSLNLFSALFWKCRWTMSSV